MANYCPNCGRELKGEDFCPGCGANVAAIKSAQENGAIYTKPPAPAAQQPQRKMRRGCLIAVLMALVLIIIIIIIAVLSGGEGNVNPADSGPSNTDTPSPAAKAPDVELLGDTTMRSDGFSLYIDGSLRNNTNRNYTYVQITFGIYDADGSKRGSALANINNLGAGETWKFSAIYFGTVDEGGTYKLDDITAV